MHYAHCSKKASLITKIAFTLFIIIVVPAYWKNYGLQNFLWLSDIGLFLTLGALWLKSSLLMSIAAVGVLPAEVAWNIDFFIQLLSGHNVLGLAHYMFEPNYTLFLKILSLFHIIMPVFWLWYLAKWGYNRQAIKYMILLMWALLPLTYMFTSPAQNINWVFIPEIYKWTWMPPLVWLALLIIGFPLLVFLPMHKLLERSFKMDC